MDEYAFVKEDLFWVFQPLLGTLGSFMFMSSSEAKDSTHWSARIRGSKSKTILDIPFEKICDKCKLLPVAEMIMCTHNVEKTALHKNRKALDELMTGLNLNQAANIRENLGGAVEQSNAAFPEQYVKALFAKANLYTNKLFPESYLICIDPAYGGSNNTAIIGIVKQKGEYVIVWVDLLSASNDLMNKIMNCLYKFHEKMRKTVEVPVVIAIESIARADGENLNILIKQRSERDECYRNMHVIKDASNEKSGMLGVGLNKKRKYEMLIKTQTIVELGYIQFYDKCETSNLNGIEYVKNEMELELSKYRGVNYGESEKIDGTLKSNSGKSGKNNDDLVLAFIMCPYWYSKFWTVAYYANQRPKPFVYTQKQ
jgi:hypothetical protein